MRARRRKLNADARDKVFGILGVLPETIRSEFPVDYSLSIKEVYVNVVDLLLSTTDRLDVIYWSHITETTALGHLVTFSASGDTTAEYRFLDERRKQLEISAMHLDIIISAHGIAVGTLCTTADYIMAFLHWRALLLNTLNADDSHGKHRTHFAAPYV
ncbi:hypothetical protein BU26DRAFT_572642 [Trematosphaeria pertusa]|uniref:Uncharacterized protein n=1 Tax=Trematosphaeria pertusa TaxID=390896 RepID=A0A6A6HSP1_9PLEO|nr:uncharacterized protein BU26DRAFT_572642 [Trematosphaeria pertusa]KAF2240450.1 hypothetical protein BU26DRAFT_572642 [Trematosphaeria pertusa]